MRIVYVVSLFPCWSETFIVREIRELIARGIDVRILSLKHPEEAMVQDDARALLDRVVYPKKGLSGVLAALGRLVRQPGQSASEVVQLLSHFAGQPKVLAKNLVVWWRMLGFVEPVRALAPKQIHAHWATYPSTAAMHLSHRLGIPYSFTCHAHDIFLEDHLIVRKLETARVGVTISEFNRRFLQARFPSAPVARMAVIHCGVSPAQYEFRDFDRQPRLLLAVGRLDPIKGFEYLVDACALLAKRGVDFECRIVGEGPLRSELQSRIDAADLGGRVTLVGSMKQGEVRGLLHTARLFVLPSVVTATGDRDGIPVALMEAMACGTPVVSTRVSGIPELIEDGQSGLLADAGDADQLALALQRLLDDPDLAARMAQQARRVVEREFDVTKEAGKLIALLG